jgi:hypothetical protein
MSHGAVLLNRCDAGIMGPFPSASIRCHATAGARIAVGPGWGYQGLQLGRMHAR